jgi:putative spermidine/putrescine transport system permease protein
VRKTSPFLLCGPVLAMYAVLLAAPLAMTVLLSFNSYSRSLGIVLTWDLRNYAEVIADSYFLRIFGRTLQLAVAVTLISAAIGAPEAWIISRLSPRWRTFSLLVVLGPLLVSVVVRTLGWTILMGGSGLLNQAFAALGLPRAEMLFSLPGVVIALTHVLVPFMVLAVWTALQQVDPATENAAASLGASPAQVFLRVVLPQAMPGVLSGSIIVFSLAASAFATPALIGGRRLKVAATAIYDEFLASLNWPLGAAIAVLLVVSVVAIVLLWNRLVERRFAAMAP